MPLAARSSSDPIPLPVVRHTGAASLEDCLTRRRSIREFTSESLSAQDVSQLLWAAQGQTAVEGYRTAPSAGALFPLELYAVDATGVSCYRPQPHDLVRTVPVDVRRRLRRAALDQDALCAPCIFVIAAALERTHRKYGARAERYVMLEAGHAAQNLLLQAVALELGAVPIGAFDDEQVRRAIELPPDEHPLLLVAVGHAARG